MHANKVVIVEPNFVCELDAIGELVGANEVLPEGIFRMLSTSLMISDLLEVSKDWPELSKPLETFKKDMNESKDWLSWVQQLVPLLVFLAMDILRAFGEYVGSSVGTSVGIRVVGCLDMYIDGTFGLMVDGDRVGESNLHVFDNIIRDSNHYLGHKRKRTCKDTEAFSAEALLSESSTNWYACEGAYKCSSSVRFRTNFWAYLRVARIRLTLLLERSLLATTVSRISASIGQQERTGQNVYFGVGSYGNIQSRGGLCYRITVSSVAKDLLVQVVNQGADVPDGNFDLMVADGGFGLYDSCSPDGSTVPMYNAPATVWGELLGGVQNHTQCNNLPVYPICGTTPADNLQDLCHWSFNAGLRIEAVQTNPVITKMCQVACPSELYLATGVRRSDEVNTGYTCKTLEATGGFLTRMMDCADYEANNDSNCSSFLGPNKWSYFFDGCSLNDSFANISLHSYSFRHSDQSAFYCGTVVRSFFHPHIPNYVKS
eukprot:gene19030-19376_t